MSNFTGRHAMTEMVDWLQAGADGNETCAVEVVRAYNGSGGANVAGDVVIKQLTSAFTADRIAMTTTTSSNSTAGLGMVYEAIADGAVGRVQIFGPTTVLKVDGNTDIAIGDYVGTFTTAKVGLGGATADARMAIALEAYTTNDALGVIDAFLICRSLTPF